MPLEFIMRLLFDQCFGWELVVLQITLSMLGESFNISIGVGVEVTMKNNLHRFIEGQTHSSNR